MPRHETEIKLAVRNRRPLTRRLRELGFRRVQARHFESNVLFDFKDLRLRKAHCLLRLRFEDRSQVLTFKGAPLRSLQYKIRGEIETRVEDGRRLREILENLGLHEVFRYDKFRTVFAPKDRPAGAETPVLVYDETPIGNYLELEGRRRWIDAVARRLGYRREEYITASYTALYYQQCLEQGREPGNMVFPARKS